MSKLFCVSFFILLNLTCVAQDTDSVSIALLKASHDSVRVKILSYQSENAADGIWEGYTIQLKELTEKKLVEEKAPDLRKFYSKHLATALNNLGLAESNKGNYVQSATYWKESQKMAREAGDLSLEAVALSNLCRQYYNSGQLEKAFDGFHQALKIHRSTSDTSRIATSLNYLGDIYRTQNDLPNAAKSYNEALQLLEAVHDTLRLADAYNRLGMVATLKSDEKLALTYYTNALNIYERKGLTRGEINMQFQLGKLKAKMTKWKEALPHYYKTLAMLKKTEQNYILVSCLSSIGQAHYQLEQMDSASYYFNKHILLDKNFKYPDMLLETTKLSYLIHKQRGNITKALTMHELLLRAKDSIFNDNSRKAVLKSQYKYEYDKKALLDSLKIETEQNVMEARLVQAKTERYLLLMGIAFITVIAFFIVYRIRLKQKIKELRFRNKIASDLHDDVGSALSSISIFSEVANQKINSNQEDAKEVITKIGSTSRSILEDMSDIVWTISPRNDSIRTLTDRMNSFAQNFLNEINIVFHFKVDEPIKDLKLSMEQRKNLYLIFKEAINNAAKYAKADCIEVALQLKGKNLEMSISDNGIGFDVQSVLKGNGLDNMQQRAAEIKALFAIQSSAKTGTTLTVNLKTP